MARKKAVWTPEARAALAAKMKGNRNGAANKGRVFSEDSLEKMSVAAKARPSNNKGKTHVPGGWRLRAKARMIFLDTKERGVTLAMEQVLALLQLPCHYCGLEPNWGPAKEVETGVCRPAKQPMGLDRKDPTLRPGYTPENVVPCCWPCNSSKHDSSYEFYVEKHPYGAEVRR